MKRLSVTDAENLALQLRAKVGMSVGEPVNVKTLLRKLGILTWYRPLSENSYGISIKTDDALFILVNSNSTRGRQHFTIAHELYHLFFDEKPEPHMCGVAKSPVERDADSFASALLMPREGVIQEISSEEVRMHKVDLGTLIRVEQLFGVSRKAMLCRLKDLKLIDDEAFDKLGEIGVIDSAIAYGYDKSLYVGGNEGVVIGDFGEKARRLYENDKISEGHYLELLNIWNDDKPEN